MTWIGGCDVDRRLWKTDIRPYRPGRRPSDNAFVYGVLAMAGINLLLRPLGWEGGEYVLLGTVAVGSLVLTWLGIRFWLRVHRENVNRYRRKHGLCLRCGYAIDSIPVTDSIPVEGAGERSRASCPECGFDESRGDAR